MGNHEEVPTPDERMADIYLPDGTLNPDETRFARMSDERVAELEAHLRSEGLD